MSQDQEILSPDGRFKLVLRSVDNGEGRWAYLDVDVMRVAEGGPIGKTSRNLGNPSIFHFVQQDGKDYLVLSENYHGGYMPSLRSKTTKKIDEEDCFRAVRLGAPNAS